MQMYNETIAHTGGFVLSAVGMTGDAMAAYIAAIAAAINALVLLARLGLKAYHAFKAWRAGKIDANELLDAVEDVAEGVQNIAEHSKPNK